MRPRDFKSFPGKIGHKTLSGRDLPSVGATFPGQHWLFNYMYVRVFHPWNRAVVRVFHPNFTVWSPGVSSWKTPPDHRLLWTKTALRSP